MLTTATLVLVFGAFTLSLAAFVVFWRRVQRPVPNLDGEVRIPGLHAPVEILRDRHGIPHIYATTDADMFCALGFVHAQDRLWQMEQKRRVAHGTLAEVFGESALDADRFSRVIGFRRSAVAELASLDTDEMLALETYAQGVNEFIRQHPGRLAAEFSLRRIRPEPWTPLDTIACMKVIAWDFSVGWESELVRLLLISQLGAEAASDLEAEQPEQLSVPDESLSDRGSEVPASMAQDLLDAYERIRPWLGVHDHPPGSNSWVVSPARSATGRPLLASDTHMGVQLPVQWYEAHVSSPGYHASGATFPGVPGVWCGHNDSLAWGMTNSHCDVQDLYLERPEPSEHHRFESDGHWLHAEVLEESIVVRGHDSPHTERMMVTRHGPVVNALVHGELPGAAQGLPLSLQWTGHRAGKTLRSLLSLNRARNWESFTDALAEWSAPAVSFTYADSEGNIGFCMAGDIPVRGEGNGLLPSPGWNSSYDWAGFVPHSQLPRLLNPDGGHIVTANNLPMFASAGSGIFGMDYDVGWRAQQLEEILLDKDHLTLRDVGEMQMDTGSAFARRLAPWFGRIEPADTYERIAGELLRKWNYRMEADSTAATVFEYAWRSLLALTFGDKIGQYREAYFGESLAPRFPDRGFGLRAAASLARLIDEHAESHWYADAASGRSRDRSEILAEALKLAVARLRRDLGDNARRWEWGRVHQIRFTHPLGSARMLRTFFNRGPFPIGGDSTTPLQTGDPPSLPPELVRVIPTYRQIIDTGNWDQVQSVIATGQSGHPLSSHYADQIDMWREGSYHLMAWSKEAVESAAVYRLILRPGSSGQGQPIGGAGR